MGFTEIEITKKGQAQIIQHLNRQSKSLEASNNRLNANWTLVYSLTRAQGRIVRERDLRAQEKGATEFVKK